MRNKKASPKRRSGCPLNASVRDIGAIAGRCWLSATWCSGDSEGIPGVLRKDRDEHFDGSLWKLEASGILTTERDRSDGRRLICLLTVKGIDLGPLRTQMVPGQTHTTIAAIRRWSGSYIRTSNNFWLPCHHAGPKRQAVQRPTKSDASQLGQVVGQLVQCTCKALLQAMRNQPQRSCAADQSSASTTACNAPPSGRRLWVMLPRAGPAYLRLAAAKVVGRSDDIL